jgi:CRP-like cAMP-binding protein
MTGRVSRTENAAHLREIPLFAGLDAAALEEVAACVSELAVPEGQTLTQPHEPASGLFVIAEGSVCVELRGEDVELGPGEFFGEIGLLLPDQTRTARVRATSPTRCLAISRMDFEDLVRREPSVALELARTLARRLLPYLSD